MIPHNDEHNDEQKNTRNNSEHDAERNAGDMPAMKSVSADVPAPAAAPESGFAHFGLPSKLMQALNRIKFTTPTPIQMEAIPLALAGNDILGSAQTGTGKTGAFGIPVIAKLMEDPNAMALIMTPTRELAAQVAANLQQMIPVPTIKAALLIGGEAMFKQLRQLDSKPRLIVGTPGRINDHLERGSLKLTNANFLVLDETDRMLDMGFGPQIDQILTHMKSKRQTMMFSATLPANIISMSRKYMTDAKRIAVGSNNAPIAKIQQELVRVVDAEKYNQLLEQLRKRTGSVIIFVKTKFGTERLSTRLNKDDQRSDAIHGDLHQRRRDRVIQGFRDKKYRILVATDVAARGLDIPHIETVINYDMPQAPEDYIHRIGRTARAGAEGAAVNFLTGADNGKWNAIQRLLNPGKAPAGGEREERSYGGRKKSGGGSFFNKRKFGGPRSDDRSDAPAERKPYAKYTVGERKERPAGDRPERAERSERPAGDRPFGDRKPFKKFDGERKERPAGDRPFGDRKPFKKFDGERKERPAGDRPERGDRPFGERKERPAGDRPFGDRKPFKKFDGERKERPAGDRPFGERKPFKKFDGERKERPAGDRPFGERKPFKKFDGERKERPAGDRPERSEGGERRPFNKFKSGGGAGGKFKGKPKPRAA